MRTLRPRRSRRTARERFHSALPAGLRWRLTAWVAGVLLVSAAVVFFVVYQDTGSQLRSEIDRDISGDTGPLLQSLHPLSGQEASRVRGAAVELVLPGFSATAQ